MRIEELTAFVVQIPFRFSFKHALAERRRADSVLLRLTLDNGVCGWGEAVPRAYLTGESVDSVLDTFAEWKGDLAALDFAENVNPLPTLFPLYEKADAARRNAAYAAVDVAAVDAVANAANRPAGEILGIGTYGQKPVRLTAPLGGGGVKSLRILTRLFKFLGFTDFKLKVGLRDNDQARLTVVRKILGNDPRYDLRIDANAAWNEERAVAELREWAQFALSSCEQPTPPGGNWTEIFASTGMPLMADESLCTRADAEKLLAAGRENAVPAVALWNVRLAKNGGFNGLFALRDLALANGVRLHLGALVGETSLLTAAGRLAAVASDFRHVEYGFPRILLRADPFRGGPAGYRGRGEPLAARRGFGVRVLPEILKQITTREIRIC